MNLNGLIVVQEISTEEIRASAEAYYEQALKDGHSEKFASDVRQAWLELWKESA